MPENTTDVQTLHEVMSLYDLAPASPQACRALAAGSGNRVYAIEAITGRVILRLSHPARTRQWLDLETAVLDYLARQRFPAVRLRPTPTGDLFVQHDGRFWTAFEYVDAALAVQPDDVQLATLAQLQARLHRTLAGFPQAQFWASWASHPRPRKTWAYVVPLADSLDFLDQPAFEQRLAEIPSGSLSEAILVPIRECRRRLQDISRRLPKLPGMLTHNDYGQYNVLFAADGTATVIDFDLLCWESAAANLARALSVVARRQWMGPFEPQRAAAYLAAYEAEQPLGDSQKAALPSLLRLYVLQYVIFHALLCIEEFRTGSPDPWVQAMRDDLQRDDELVAVGTQWLGL